MSQIGVSLPVYVCIMAEGFDALHFLLGQASKTSKAGELDFLEDILKQYGVTADYWSSPDDIQPTESAESISTALEDVVTASEDWRVEIQAVLDRDSQTRFPLFVRLADLRTENGNPETALKAYEAAVLDEADPTALCELGYLLLQRCRVEELPLCDKDFDGTCIDFGGGEKLLISSYTIDPENPGPEFPNKPALLNLAIRAFGLTYVRCAQQRFTEQGQTWGETWRELVALEGLRAAFLGADNGADNLGAVESVCGSFYGRLEDFEETSSTYWDTWGGLIEPFVANFRETAGYLRGRGTAAAPSRELEERLRDLLHSELKPVQALHNRTDFIVEKLIDLDQRSELIWEQVRESAKRLPETERANIRIRLEAALGDAWGRLENESQEDLIDAEVFSAECKKHGAGWHGPATSYGRAMERELKKSVEYLRARIGAGPIGKVETLGKLIEDLPELGKWTRNDKRLSSAAARLTSDPEYNYRLHELNNIRTRAAHPKKQKVSRADVLRMQRLLLHHRDNAEPLLAVIVQARDGS